MFTQNELLDLELKYKKDETVLRMIRALRGGGYYERGQTIPRPAVKKCDNNQCACKGKKEDAGAFQTFSP
jgi:hypothetical protein